MNVFFFFCPKLKKEIKNVKRHDKGRNSVYQFTSGPQASIPALYSRFLAALAFILKANSFLFSDFGWDKI